MDKREPVEWFLTLYLWCFIYIIYINLQKSSKVAPFIFDFDRKSVLLMLFYFCFTKVML